MSKLRLSSVLVIFPIAAATYFGYRWVQSARHDRSTEIEISSDSAANSSSPKQMQAQLRVPGPSEAGSVTAPTAKSSLDMIKTITADSSSNQAYEVFVALKHWLAENPEAIGQVISVLSEPNDSSANQKRQRSILYGALAETKSQAAAEALTDLLKQAQHEDDAIQAAAALGDHKAPPPRALDVLWEHGQMTSSPSQNAAILAFGSVAHHLGSAADHMALQVLNAASAAKSPDQKVEFLAVMGNHGSVQYLPFLLQSAEDSNEDVRAAAVYGARYHNTEDAGAFISQVATKDTSNKVKAEAIRALTMQLDLRRDFARIAEIANSTANEDVQLEAARVLRAAYERSRNPEAQFAIDSILKMTKNKNVHAFISQGGVQN